MFGVTAEPTIAFVDAFRLALTSDTTYVALVTGTYGHVSETAKVNVPYVVLGHRTVDGNAGAMQVAGQLITLQVDGWSGAKGPAEIEAIGSRIFAVMERRRGFSVPGFAVVDGSLHREYGDYLYEFDTEQPQNSLYRMTQRWVVEIHES